MIETLDDLVEDLANLLYKYGAHQEVGECKREDCRACWTMDLKARIIATGDVYDSALDKRTIAHLLDRIERLEAGA